MVGSGEASSPVRLWWARLDDGAVRSVEISGLPYGTESNPPAWDPERRIIVAYDAATRSSAPGGWPGTSSRICGGATGSPTPAI